MPRKLKDWIASFIEYTAEGEAPTHFYFWTAVSTIAGALQRKVWIDQKMFQWYANMYIVLVAPPGIVSKSTTAELGMDLLRALPAIKFGPSVVTWQSLVQTFGLASEMFQLPDGSFVSQSPLTIASSEFGNLLDPSDTQMVDTLVNLWDGKSFQKGTKSSGNDDVVNPWINLIACTTPDWIAGNFPEYMIGGGFTSRCLFVYAGAKSRYVAYPGLRVADTHATRRDELIHDLEHISTAIVGEYTLTPGALAWGTEWYRTHYEVDIKAMDSSRFGGYAARKQTHIHKLAMVLAAATRDERVITEDDLATAAAMVTGLEAEMVQVFAKIGQSKESIQIDRFVTWVERQGHVALSSAIRFMQAHFPFARDFQDVIATCVNAGQIHMTQRNGQAYLSAGAAKTTTAPGGAASEQ